MMKLIGIVQYVAHEIFTEHGNDPKLADDMKAYSKLVWEKMEQAHIAEGKFLCILHNDAWTNNFMFR